MGYIENNLTVYDELELEEAGLDVDELAEMDWGDRYDAIEEAGLDPMDYDYGWLNDMIRPLFITNFYCQCKE